VVWKTDAEFLMGDSEDSPLGEFTIHVPLLVGVKGECMAIRVLTVKNTDWKPIIQRDVDKSLSPISQDAIANQALGLLTNHVGFTCDTDYDYTSRAQEIIARKDVDSFSLTFHDPGKKGGGPATFVSQGKTKDRKRIPIREDRPDRLAEAIKTDVLHKAMIKTTEDLLGFPQGTSLSLYPSDGSFVIGSMLKGASLGQFLDYIAS